VSAVLDLLVAAAFEVAALLATAEAACAQLFRKLDLEPSPDLNRRVLAVLTFLRS
jgi:hypothetical protein